MTVPRSVGGGSLRPISPHPEQLPIVLQVLLSQAHRLPALILLCKFLDLGPWAVNLALSIGIFPYVLKLLQAPSADLKPVLIFIWARILGVFRGCQEDLIKQVTAAVPNRPIDLPFHYFAKVLSPVQHLPIPNVSEHRAMCAFILSILCRDFQPGQLACLSSDAGVLDACLMHVEDDDPLLRQWSALCLGQLWSDFERARGLAVRKQAHTILHKATQDPVPEVRAAVLYALGTLVGTSGAEPPKTARRADEPRPTRSLAACATALTGVGARELERVESGIAMASLTFVTDASPVVRAQVAVLLSAIVVERPAAFAVAAFHHAEEELERRRTGRAPATTSEARQEVINRAITRDQEGGRGGRDGDSDSELDNDAAVELEAMMQACIYKTLLDLAADPFPSVAERACAVVDFIHDQLLSSPLGSAPGPVLRSIVSTIEAAPAMTTYGPMREPSVDGMYGKRGSLASVMRSFSQVQLDGIDGPYRGARTAAPSPTNEPPDRSLRPSASADALFHNAAAMAAESESPPPDEDVLFQIEADMLAAETDRIRRRQVGASSSSASSMNSSNNSSVNSDEDWHGPDPSEYGLPLRSDYFDACCRSVHSRYRPR